MKSWRPSYTEGRAFVELDVGLARMTEHAKRLGVGGIVLLLDELILWMAGLASTPEKLQREAQKLPKLVEGQELRHLPIISFIARQRDLAEMVGERLAGHDQVMLAQQLEFSRGRFGTIELKNQNLPVIIEQRVLKPRSPEAKKAIDAAFATLQRSAGDAWAALRTGEYRDDDFRKLYPFSPALVEALVALSDMLQRQRTAIKLLVELITSHIGDLPLGRVVPVGDLFDLLAGGEEPMDGVMRARFQAAKRLYQFTLLDRLRERHGTDSEAKCQRMRLGHPPSRGCAGCAEAACRNDNRLVKTLLLAALVPEAKPFKELTVGRLVQLNHGVVRSQVPGNEVSLAVSRLQALAARVSQVHLGPEEDDPTVAVQLDGIDLAPVLRQAEHLGGPGAQGQVLRDVLFDLLGVDNRDGRGLRLNETVVKVAWLCTDRRVRVRFGNVRSLDPEALRCAEDEDLRVILDYPFDEDGFSPADDLAVVERFADAASGTWTVAWLPSFLSKKSRDLLAQLAIVTRILEGDPRQFLRHLSGDLQERAVSDLRNLRQQQETRLKSILHQAYGLANAAEGDLDPARLVEGAHLHILQAGKRIRPTLAVDFKSQWAHLVDAALRERHPRPPDFEARLATRSVAERVVELFGRLMERDDRRLELDPDALREARGTLGALHIVKVVEGAVLLKHDGLLSEIEQRRQRKGEALPRAALVRSLIDEAHVMGLERAAEDVVLRAYARSSARTFRILGQPYHPTAGTPIPDDTVLEQPALPDAASWTRALDLAGKLFGASIGGRALHAENLDRLGQAMTIAAREHAPLATRAAAALRGRLGELGVEPPCDRLTTAESAKALCTALLGALPVDQVKALASVALATSPDAVQRSLAHAATTATVLEDQLLFGVLRQLAPLASSNAEARQVLEDARAALRQDELLANLAEQLRVLAAAGQAILIAQTPPAPFQHPPQPYTPAPPQPVTPPTHVPGQVPSGPGTFERHRHAHGRDDALRQLEAAVREARAALDGTTLPTRITITVDVDGEGQR